MRQAIAALILRQNAATEILQIKPKMPSPPPARVYTGVCHGTLGELYQGPCRDSLGNPSIAVISLPITRYAFAHFMQTPTRIALDNQNDVKIKSAKARNLYIEHYKFHPPAGHLIYTSELSPGKGMASSTADIVATIRCMDAIFKRNTGTTLIAAILRQIERSDSVFLDEHALYLSDKQQIVDRFSRPISLWACYIDEGTEIATEGTADKLLQYYDKNTAAYAETLNAMVTAFHRGHVQQICACSTRSACLAQEVFPKQHFDTLLHSRNSLRADGIVVAHTGSLIGLLFTRKPSVPLMGELSSLFMSLGHRCRFVRTGVH